MHRLVRCIALATLLTACSHLEATDAATSPQDFPTIEKGRYLAVVADCAACHTASGSNEQYAGGRSIETPFGNLLAPNITPDHDTGIGSWTDQEFVSALLNGKDRTGSHLYPAMPYPYLTRMSREDALAIRAYLRTVPPVHHRVVANQLPFPFDIRASLWAWKALFFHPGRFQARSDKSVEWNRGAYLVEGPMHCGMCHTPKNWLGGDKTTETLQGYSLQGWFAPNITNETYRGLGGWSVDEIVAYLKTGHNDKDAASGPMAEEVALSSSQMSDADLQAIATYLKDQPNTGATRPDPVAASEPAMKLGHAIYADECSACHKSSGVGIARLISTLAGSALVQSREPTSLLHVVLRGTRSVGTQGAPTASAMPPFGWLLTDDQVAAVTTYVRNAWGNAAPAVTAADVSHARASLSQRNE